MTVRGEGKKEKVQTYLEPPALMMQIVKRGAVVVDEAERVPREDVAAVIADGFDGGEGAEEHALPRR